jgi:copper oxidase (laccase) domain-containing protein
MEWRERGGVRWLEAELPGARAAFSTRVGGVSEGPYEALNVAILTGDDPDRVRENRDRLATALGRDASGVVMGRQVHGAVVKRHEQPQEPRVYADAARSPDEVDAHATADSALTPLVMVADCLPVALSGPGGVAMAHCGWRGLASGIVAEGVRAIDATAAAIGPGIGPCCYEVGEEAVEFVDPGASRSGGCSTTAVATQPLSGRGGRSRLALHQLQSRAALLPPPRRRRDRDRRGWSGDRRRGDRWR